MKKNIKKALFSSESIVALIIINILTVSAALKPDFLQSLETISYDFSMNKNRQLTNSNDKVAIITIDKQSIKQFGQWPWERSVIASMLDKLTIAKAKTIGLQFPLIGNKNNHNIDSINELKKYVANTKGIKRKQTKKI